MRLKELKNIISEEYKLFLEAEEDTADDKEKKDDKPKKKPSVAVSDKDVDADGADSEDTLRQIYDMLKDYFEGDKEPKEPKAPKGPGGPGGPGGPAGGPPPMMDAPPMDMALQERFKKLANIIKG